MLPADGIRGLLACLWLSLRVSRVASGLFSCDEEHFVLFAVHDRTDNRTSVHLQTYYTAALVRLEGDRLTSPYSWVNVSVMEAERKFAVAQAELLNELTSRLPHHRKISIKYAVASAMVTIVYAADSSYAISDRSSFVAAQGLNETFMKPYVGGRNVSEFLTARTAVIGRWREICKSTVKLDVAENASVAFVYHQDSSTFECSVESRVPVSYYLYLMCPGTNTSIEIATGKEDGGVLGNLVLVKIPRCRVETANCTVASPYKWSKTLKAAIPPVTEKVSGAGVNTAVSVTVLILVLGLLVFVYFRYRSSMGPVREVIGLIRGRVGYVLPGERCACINSASTEE